MENKDKTFNTPGNKMMETFEDLFKLIKKSNLNLLIMLMVNFKNKTLKNCGWH